MSEVRSVRCHESKGMGDFKKQKVTEVSNFSITFLGEQIKRRGE